MDDIRLCLQDSSADALDQLSVDNEREREELLSKIEIEMKEAEQEVVHQYMSHYLLGLKVNMITCMQVSLLRNRLTCMIMRASLPRYFGTRYLTAPFGAESRANLAMITCRYCFVFRLLQPIFFTTFHDLTMLLASSMMK